MPQATAHAISREAVDSRQFLAESNPQAARRAGQAIERQFALLETSPEIGRPLTDLPQLRELLIGFGDSGYARSIATTQAPTRCMC